MECTKATRNCACVKKECPRNGKCCECVAAHRENGNLPFCLGKE